MTSTSGKQTQAELILAALPEQERRDAALCFYNRLHRGMKTQEVIDIQQYADQMDCSFVRAADTMSRMILDEQAAEKAQQGALL